MLSPSPVIVIIVAVDFILPEDSLSSIRLRKPSTSLSLNSHTPTYTPTHTFSSSHSQI